jgi:predicted phosphodiesterase
MTRVLAVGDIHGVYDKLIQLEPYFTQVDQTIFVGDYVDRGPDPIGVLEYCTLVPNSIRLVGNHEFSYLKKIHKGHRRYPHELKDADFDRFVKALHDCVGATRAEQRHYWRNEWLAVSHAPAGLFQHDWDKIPFDRFLYGWTLPHTLTEEGFPTRVTLAEKYPNEVNNGLVIHGHIHSDKIHVGHNQLCVDLCCGVEGGKLGAVIIEDGVLVDTIII